MMPTEIPTSKEHSPAMARRALVCACLLGFAFSANYTNHAPLVPALTEAFGFSLALAGFLTTGIFLTHAAMQIPGGHLADRLGAKHVATAALALVCAGNFAIAFSAAYWQLLFWKVFVGFGTGTSFVAGARYVSGLFAGRRLHLAQGLYGGSVLLGSGFVIFSVPRLAAALGWRGAFMITAEVATAAWVIWMIAAPSPRSRTAAPGSFRGLISDPQLWMLGIVQMASFGLVMVLGAWVSTHLRTGLRLAPADAGLLGSLALLLGIITRPLGGKVVQLAGVRRLLRFSLMLNVAGCFILGFAENSLGWTVAAIVILGTGCGLPYAALFTRASSLHPARAGAAMGLVNMLGIIMILVAPPLVGKLADQTGSFQSGFQALGAFCLLACIGTWRIKEQ